MEKIYFVTTNKHKAEEAAAVMKGFDIEVEQIDMEYEENHDESLEQIAISAAKKLAGELKKPIVVEDTGLFFRAWPGFPGALPKFVFNTLGYKGIFKLLAGVDRAAYFQTVLAYCGPNGKPITFSDTMEGEITEQVFNEDKDAMPYDRIFIPDGERKTISDMTIAKKNSFSQRGKAFCQLGEYLTR